MKRATLRTTHMAVYLSLNVEVIDDRRGTDFFAWPLLSFTWLLTIFWFVQVQVVRWWQEVDALVNQCRLALTVAGIGCRSLAWGVGF